MREFYAWSPAISSAGELELSDSGLAAGQPVMEAVAFTLRTQVGTYLPDPDDGVDLRLTRKQTPDIKTKWGSELKRAVQRYVRDGLITDLKVVIEVGDGVLLDEVSFIDPRDNAKPPARRTVRTQR